MNRRKEIAATDYLSSPTRRYSPPQNLNLTCQLWSGGRRSPGPIGVVVPATRGVEVNIGAEWRVAREVWGIQSNQFIRVYTQEPWSRRRKFKATGTLRCREASGIDEIDCQRARHRCGVRDRGTPVAGAVRVGVESPIAGDGLAWRDLRRKLRLHQEGRHLLPGHRSEGAEQGWRATAGDSPPRELLDPRAERVAGWHVGEHLASWHAGRWNEIGGREGLIQAHQLLAGHRILQAALAIELRLVWLPHRRVWLKRSDGTAERKERNEHSGKANKEAN
jgi:hypothetical protein